MDPRAEELLEFSNASDLDHIEMDNKSNNCKVVIDEKLLKGALKTVPLVLKSQGKATSVHPNIDSVSGSLLTQPKLGKSDHGTLSHNYLPSHIYFKSPRNEGQLKDKEFLTVIFAIARSVGVLSQVK
jgi:citrate synthase